MEFYQDMLPQVEAELVEPARNLSVNQEVLAVEDHPQD
jgi:hypothetical protein